MSGCSRFQDATEVECTALYDHAVAVAAAEAADSTVEGMAASLGKKLLEVGGDALMKFSGEKDKVIRRCQVKMKKYDVEVCMDAKTMDAVQACISERSGG